MLRPLKKEYIAAMCTRIDFAKVTIYPHLGDQKR